MGNSIRVIGFGFTGREKKISGMREKSCEIQQLECDSKTPVTEIKITKRKVRTKTKVKRGMQSPNVANEIF